MSNLEQMIINMIMQNNPQVKNIINEVRSSGKTPEQLFYEKAKAKGVNPEDILSKLR